MVILTLFDTISGQHLLHQEHTLAYCQVQLISNDLSRKVNQWEKTSSRECPGNWLMVYCPAISRCWRENPEFEILDFEFGPYYCLTTVVSKTRHTYL